MPLAAERRCIDEHGRDRHGSYRHGGDRQGRGPKRQRPSGVRAARFGRKIGFNISARPIIADTEAAAWDKAHAILAKLEGGTSRGWSRQEATKDAVDNAGRRLMGFAAEKDLHDTCLWMPITKATGALGNTSALVGTPRQVADALLEYYKLGVGSFLIRGFDPERDTAEFGRELIPMIREGAARVDGDAA